MAQFTLWTHEEHFYPGSRNMEANLRTLRRREVWLWSTTFAGMLLSATAFVLLSVPTLFPTDNPYFRLDPEITTRALMALVLLLNAHAVHRQWLFQRLRNRLTQRETGWLDTAQAAVDSYDASARDPVTGLCTRSFAAEWLARQVAHARSASEPLTLLLLDLENLGQVNDQYGRSYTEQALQEFARRLKKASRGCDLAVRMGANEFLLALPGCNVGGAKRVLNRLGPVVEMNCEGTSLTLAYSAAWIDYQLGESPGDLLARADEVLKLYKKASTEGPSEPVVAD